MHIDKNLQFIAAKIKDIEVALFHCQSNNLLRIPTSIIYTFRVDDEGNILFFLKRPKQHLSQFEKEFPVRMNYFRKGVSHYMNVYGVARIIDDPEELLDYELNQTQINKALNTEILIKVKILKADYYEYDPEKNDSLLNKVKSFIYSFIAGQESDARIFDFSSKGLLYDYV
jgi:hypothetical protein